MATDEDNKDAFTAPMFAPTSSSQIPLITAADLHDLFSAEFSAYTPTARELTTYDGSYPVALEEPNSIMSNNLDVFHAGVVGDSAVSNLVPKQGKLLKAKVEAEKMLEMQASRPKRKRPEAREDLEVELEEEEEETEMMSGDTKMERRLRNREHAKRSRLRKRFLLESLQSQLSELRSENKALRDIVRERFPAAAQRILTECTQTQSDLLEGLEEGDNKVRPKVTLPNSNGEKASSNARELSRQLVEQDYRLIRALQHSQQCFAISDPGLADNPIVYASQGFLDLTGYTMRQVLGRNCRFLQGPATDQEAVEAIREGICEGRDVSVCLLNYKADGTPFWNQFFIAPLCAADGSIVNFVGVQCEVQSNTAEDMQMRVKRIKNIEAYVDES